MTKLGAWLIDRVLCAVRVLWWFRSVTSVGRGVRLRSRAWVHNQGSIRIGDRVCFYAGPTGVHLSSLPGGSLEIGDDTMVNYGCSFIAAGQTKIGKRCRIGMNVLMTDSHLHTEDPSRRAVRPEPGGIVIEDDVWIAARVTILPGVTLGRGCIIGAGSVVTRSIPPDMMAAGNPARVIRPTVRSDQAEPFEALGRHPIASGFHAKIDGREPVSDGHVPQNNAAAIRRFNAS
jgi:acetyltransferase-like isoleucine patch superfamily enzyme